MCIPLVVVGVALAAVAAAGSIYQGVASKQAADTEAKMYDIQRKEARTQTSQASRDRINEFMELESANQLSIAVTGFSPESFAHLGEANRRQALADASRIEQQGKIEQGRLKFAKGQKKAEGTAALVGGFTQAAGQIGSSLMSYGAGAGGFGGAGSVGG